MIVQEKPHFLSLVTIFLAVRLMMIIALPLDGLSGYSDLAHFYNLAGLGWPYLHYWVEFPPLFPFLSRILYLFSFGREHTYDYLLILLFTLVQAGSLIIFIKLTQMLYSPREAEWRSWVYLVILIGLPYGWWYFDPLVVLFYLLAIYLVLLNRSIPAGVALAAGIMTKLFPALVLPAVWRYQSKHRAIIITSVSIGITLLLYGCIYFYAPQNTLASLRSQGGKGSWETIWALVDGNFNTGNIGALVDRLNPETSAIMSGNPPTVSPLLTLIPFLLLGIWLFIKVQINSPASLIDFIGLTWCIFLFWMPGWSPQWVMYLIPLILLSLSWKESTLMVFSLILINLLEWPVLLSRGYPSGLWLTVSVRSLLLILLGYLLYRQLFHAPNDEQKKVSVGDVVVE
jgi:hypothetical protein